MLKRVGCICYIGYMREWQNNMADFEIVFRHLLGWLSSGVEPNLVSPRCKVDMLITGLWYSIAAGGQTFIVTIYH